MNAFIDRLTDFVSFVAARLGRDRRARVAERRTLDASRLDFDLIDLPTGA